MSRRYLQLVQAILFTSVTAAQSVPPAPVMSLPVQAPAVSNIQIVADAAQCSQPSSVCGLADCSCWWQLWRAQCSSATSCPAVNTSNYTNNLPNAALLSALDNGRGGLTFTVQDTDPVLTAGTIWQYFFTVNFGSQTPWTPSAPSNPSGALTIPSIAPVTWKVYLNWDNTSCISGNTCTADVFRANCSNSAACPSFNTSAFTKINVTLTQTVTAAKTSFQAVDSGATLPLANNAIYTYAVRNTFVAYPSTPGGVSQVTQVTPTGIHQAIVNWSNASCTNLSPCSIQIYRATCSSPTNCPTYVAGNSAWKALSSNGLVPSQGAQGTSWRYTDNDAALVGSTTYVYVATNSYTGATTASSASTSFIGTTAVGRKGGKK